MEFLFAFITGLVFMCIVGWIAYEAIIKNNDRNDFTGL